MGRYNIPMEDWVINYPLLGAFVADIEKIFDDIDSRLSVLEGEGEDSLEKRVTELERKAHVHVNSHTASPSKTKSASESSVKALRERVQQLEKFRDTWRR